MSEEKGLYDDKYHVHTLYIYLYKMKCEILVCTLVLRVMNAIKNRISNFCATSTSSYMRFETCCRICAAKECSKITSLGNSFLIKKILKLSSEIDNAPF